MCRQNLQPFTFNGDVSERLKNLVGHSPPERWHKAKHRNKTRKNKTKTSKKKPQNKNQTRTKKPRRIYKGFKGLIIIKQNWKFKTCGYSVIEGSDSVCDCMLIKGTKKPLSTVFIWGIEGKLICNKCCKYKDLRH